MLVNLLFLSLILFYLFLWFRVGRKGEPVTELIPLLEKRGLLSRGRWLYWLAPVFFISLWGLAVSGFPQAFRNIPHPLEVLASFKALTLSGKLPLEAWHSFRRVMIGFLAASAVGVPLGLLAGSFFLFYNLVLPVNSFLRYIPPTAFISLLIVYFGVGETYKYAVIFLGLIFFIIQMVVDVVEDTDMGYVEMGLTMGYSRWEIFRRVIVPGAWPRIWDVLRINLSAAWTFLVAAEIVGAEKGLGHLIAVSQRFLRLGDLYAGILTFGIIGLITDRVLEILSRRLFRWYYIKLKR